MSKIFVSFHEKDKDEGREERQDRKINGVILFSPQKPPSVPSRVACKNGTQSVFRGGSALEQKIHEDMQIVCYF